MKRVTFNEYKAARDHGWEPKNEGLLDFFGGKKKGVPAGPPAMAAPTPEREPQTEEEILQAAAKASGNSPGLITSVPRFQNQGGFNRKWPSWEAFMADPTPVMQKLAQLKADRADSAAQYGAGLGHRSLGTNS